MLDYAKEIRILEEVRDEGDCFENRNVPALVKKIGEWNSMIGPFAGAMDELVGEKADAAIKQFRTDRGQTYALYYGSDSRF
jgi:hypothetical protein